MRSRSAFVNCWMMPARKNKKMLRQMHFTTDGVCAGIAGSEICPCCSNKHRPWRKDSRIENELTLLDIPIPGWRGESSYLSSSICFLNPCWAPSARKTGDPGASVSIEHSLDKSYKKWLRSVKVQPGSEVDEALQLVLAVICRSTCNSTKILRYYSFNHFPFKYMNSLHI